MQLEEVNRFETQSLDLGKQKKGEQSLFTIVIVVERTPKTRFRLSHACVQLFSRYEVASTKKREAHASSVLLQWSRLISRLPVTVLTRVFIAYAPVAGDHAFTAFPITIYTACLRIADVFPIARTLFWTRFWDTVYVPRRISQGASFKFQAEAWDQPTNVVPLIHLIWTIVNYIEKSSFVPIQRSKNSVVSFRSPRYIRNQSRGMRFTAIHSYQDKSR